MNILPPLAVIAAAVLWSLDGFLRQSLYATPSFLIVMLEHAFAAIVFSPFIYKYRSQLHSFTQQTWGSLIWISLFSGILGTFFYTKALSYVGYIDLSIVVLLQKLQPFFAILLAAIVLKERLNARFAGLAALAFVGGYLITFADLVPHFSTSGADTTAALLAIGAAFCWGTSTVFSKQALNAGNFFLITALRFLLTFVLVLIPVFYFGQQTAIETMTSHQWLSLFAIVFSTGGIALAIYYYGLKRIPASHATLYELAWPLSAVFLDWMIRGTILSLTQYLGMAILLAALVLLAKLQPRM
jgi:drug/metabolite transporter (DMT)-like permease